MSHRVGSDRRAPAIELPRGWEVREVSGPGPFVTWALLGRPDGSVVEWTSRRHRKRLGLRSAGGHRRGGWLSGASSSSVVLGALFAIGSACFVLGPLPLYDDLLSASAVAWTFFVGSVFFTSAALLQFSETVSAPPGPDDATSDLPVFRRLVGWAPHRIDWWAAAIQLVGTVFFNVTTFASTLTGLDITEERRWIWAPDALGSVCFLVSSWLACAEAGAGERGLRGRSIGWKIAAINLLGSLAFGASAVAARYVHSTGEIANLALANLGTVIGGVCFFAGALLLPVESARETHLGDVSAASSTRG
jgi:hypothetical protein